MHAFNIFHFEKGNEKAGGNRKLKMFEHSTQCYNEAMCLRVSTNSPIELDRKNNSF